MASGNSVAMLKSHTPRHLCPRGIKTAHPTIDAQNAPAKLVVQILEQLLHKPLRLTSRLHLLKPIRNPLRYQIM